MNSLMVDEKMDRLMSELATEEIDHAVIAVFVTAAKMDSDRHAVVFDRVGVFAQTLVSTWMDVERQLDYSERQ